jgi:sortase A
MADFKQSLPLPNSNDDNGAADNAVPKNQQSEEALNLIRSKLDNLYAEEPSAKKESEEITNSGAHSKHQKYMKQLLDSGQDMHAIQKAWHQYYQGLPDNEKHQVWNEFYANYSSVSNLAEQSRAKAVKAHNSKTEVQSPNSKPISNGKMLPNIAHTVIGSVPHKTSSHNDSASVREELVNKITARGKLKKRHHFQSLAFGLGMGLIVVGFLMFGFFNERFIAPFITPSLTASSSPIIVDPQEKVGPESKVIIPKINVDVPVVYDTPSTNEKDIQNSLENGVVHYPGTAVPGQNGNVVVVGHSSNNLFNSGKYKFAFVLLNNLQIGDTITMQYGGKKYVYKIYEKVIVKPTDVGVLGPTDKTASLTLITCDPPGTSINRLVVRAEQISPSLDSNIASAPNIPLEIPEVVPGNAPSLFSRLFGWL